MTDTIEDRLAAMGITLPTPAAPVANYVPYVIAGNLVVISGQLPLHSGKVTAAGLLGDTVSIEDGKRGARFCAINLIAQLRVACGGDLERVTRVVRLGGFIAATASFADHAQVMNGASDLVVEVFGERGRHARSTIGVASLPLGAAVEVEGMFEVN